MSCETQERIFNITDPAYGAVCRDVDPDYNNTPAIQAAIDACEAAGGGIVFVPPGVWGFHNLLLGENVELVGTVGSVLRVMDDWRSIVQNGQTNVHPGIGAKAPTASTNYTGPAVTSSFPGVYYSSTSVVRAIRYCAIRNLELDGNRANNDISGTNLTGTGDELIFAHPGYDIFGPYGRFLVENVYAHDTTFSIIVGHRVPVEESLLEIIDCHTANSALDAHLYLNGGNAMVRNHRCTGYSRFSYIQAYGGYDISGVAFEGLTTSPKLSGTSARIPVLVSGSTTDVVGSKTGSWEGYGSQQVTGVRAYVDLALVGDHVFKLGGGILRAQVVDVGTDNDAFTSTCILAAAGDTNPHTRNLDAHVLVTHARRGLGAIKSRDNGTSGEFTAFYDSTVKVEIERRAGLTYSNQGGGAALLALGTAERSHFHVSDTGVWAPDVGLIFTSASSRPVRACTFSGSMQPRSMAAMCASGAAAPVDSAFVDMEFSGYLDTATLAALRFDRSRRIKMFNGNFTSPGYTMATAGNGYTEKRGVATKNGTGAQTAFTIAHGLIATPMLYQVTAASAGAAGDYTVTADATNLTVTYAMAPPSGTDNVVLQWQARVGA